MRKNIQTLSIYFIYAAAAIRAVVLYSGDSQLGWVMFLLAAYGFLLFFEPWLTRQLKKTQPQWLDGYHWVYLFLLGALAFTLLMLPKHYDTFAALFFPPCLQAVLFYRRRAGFICIGVLILIMSYGLMLDWEGSPENFVMALLFGGLCYLFGAYANMIQQAEAAHLENQQMLGELQAAHRQLRDYASQMEELAAEQERNYLARELHDSVTQTVFSMNLTAQSARILMDKDTGRTAGQLDRLQELARSAMGEIQTLVSQLRSRSLAEEGLPAALQRLAVERQRRDGLNVRLEVNGKRELPEPVTAGLYRIVQEALNNVVKHARELQATVRLDLEGEPACVEIEDRGAGFDPTVASQRGKLGLVGMAERAHELGWDFVIDSQPGYGTRIRIIEKTREETV